MSWVRLLAVAALAARDVLQAQPPPIDKPLPPAADRTPRASVMLTDYRYDDLLWENERTGHRVLKNGADAVDFEVDYAPWPIDVNRRVWETQRFTLHASRFTLHAADGTHLIRMVSTIRSDETGPLVVNIGIARKPTGAERELTVDKARGLLSWWGPDYPS